MFNRNYLNIIDLWKPFQFRHCWYHKLISSEEILTIKMNHITHIISKVSTWLLLIIIMNKNKKKAWKRIKRNSKHKFLMLFVIKNKFSWKIFLIMDNWWTFNVEKNTDWSKKWRWKILTNSLKLGIYSSINFISQ